MTTQFTFDRASVRRIGEQIRRGELTQTDLREPLRKAELPQTVGRFKLLTKLEVGRFASARLLQLEPTGEPGQFEWLPTDREVQVFAGGCDWNNHWPEGSTVTCVKTAAGWMVTEGQLAGILPPGIEPFPYMVQRYVAVSSAERDTIHLDRPGTGGIAVWNDDYVVTGAESPLSDREETFNDDGVSTRPRVMGCTPMVGQPVKAAYLPFDGTLPNGDPIPESVLAALEQKPHPRAGELWAPTISGKLARTVTFLELFWFEYCSPAWECMKFTVPNPDYDPQANVCDPEHEDYDPDDVACQPSIEVEHWGIPVECSFGLSPVNSGISCDEDPPERRSAFWRSPFGWWALGNWHWGWWGSAGWWRYPSGWWNNPLYGFNDSIYWGPWGHGWWNRWWGGRPPTPDDLLELEGDDAPPDPPCGGITRRTRYGFIVWEFGWRVLGADESHEVCTVVGEMEYRSRLVVENQAAPESSCDDEGGY